MWPLPSQPLLGLRRSEGWWWGVEPKVMFLFGFMICTVQWSSFWWCWTWGIHVPHLLQSTCWRLWYVSLVSPPICGWDSRHWPTPDGRGQLVFPCFVVSTMLHRCFTDFKMLRICLVFYLLCGTSLIDVFWAWSVFHFAQSEKKNTIASFERMIVRRWNNKTRETLVGWRTT